MEKEKMEKALKDKDFVAKILAMQTPEEVQEAFKGKGVEISLEEVEILGKIINKTAQKGGELSEKELEEITGGGEKLKKFGAVCLGVPMFFGIGFLGGIEYPDGARHAFDDLDGASSYDKIFYAASGLGAVAGYVPGKIRKGAKKVVKWAKRKK